TMVTVAQGILKDIRDEMFEHMETLPIRYFDSNATGDIMSHYTNETDTLRQMISQSIPQTFSSSIMILSIFIAMFIINVPMTLFVSFMVGTMIVVIRFLGLRSVLYDFFYFYCDVYYQCSHDFICFVYGWDYDFCYSFFRKKKWTLFLYPVIGIRCLKWLYRRND